MDAKFSKDERVTQVKRELFSCIKPGDLVVEIGAGTGTNFQHLPDGKKNMKVQKRWLSGWLRLWTR